nr:PREDICTED: flocculation protein FLO11-like [Paralichthys olivaceus]
MPSTLLCFGVGVVLFSLAPSTLSFSRGASHTSCQEMIPGHIRAQPQDPQHSFVSLRTSASSYLPGQLITVTVRSSRDFMGFLLQARSVEGGGGRAGGRAGVGVRARGGTGIRSTGVGPMVMGGSWTLTPPGTHTLRCLSDGDTLTHSDKQLKRNLSFVWRAPDAPMGDIRFYITVVQSYFVYWAGIESAVVHDGSRRSWSGSKTTKVDGETTTFALQENEAAALPDLRAYSASIQLTETVDPATTTGHSLPRGSGTRSYRSLETVTRPSLETNSSAIGSDHLTNQAVNDRNSTKSSGALPNVTSGSESSGSLSAGTEEAGSDTGSFVAHTEDLKRSIFQSNRFSTAPIPTEEKAAETRLTTSVSPDITVQTSTSPRSLSSVPLLKDVDVERKERMKLQDPKLSILTKMLNIGSTFSSPSSSAISSALPSTSSTDLSTSSISSVSPSPPPLTVTSSSFSLGSSFSTSSPHLRPSPAPLRAPYNPRMSSPSPVPSQKLTMGQSLLIQNHLARSDPQPNLTPATQRTVVHANPEPHPNLDPNSKLNLGYELKTNLPKTDTKPKRPSNPPGTPDKEGKYPDIIPRHSAWELGMLLGCSAGLGMVLVVGVRYMYRQACGKRTEVTLNDREREYERGERGLIHVQECGDLVRVRRIRENSFVLLAEYDILASPGD